MGLIIALDPGQTTGVAIAEHSSGRNFQLLQSFEIAWGDPLKVFHMIYTNRANIKAIVIEEYRLFANQKTLQSQIGSEMPSSQVIGMIKLSAYLCKLTCIVFQKPSDIHSKDFQTGKPCYTLSVIPEHKKLIHAGTHCMDAYMHIRYFILTVARKQTNGKSK